MMYKKYILLLSFLTLPFLGAMTPTSRSAQGVQPSPEACVDMGRELRLVLQQSAQRHDLPSVMLALKLLTDDMIAKGQPAPSYNLCDVIVPNTNLFCQGNRNIPRIKMPQLIGKPRPGSEAAKKTPDKNGEVSGEEEFKQYLAKQGYAINPVKIPAARLKATQNELVGPKVVSMWWALKEGPSNKYYAGITAPIFISKDNYVLDGHHRWAAIVANDMQNGRLGTTIMNALQVGMGIDQLVKDANNFANEFGIEQKAG